MQNIEDVISKPLLFVSLDSRLPGLNTEHHKSGFMDSTRRGKASMMRESFLSVSKKVDGETIGEICSGEYDL